MSSCGKLGERLVSGSVNDASSVSVHASRAFSGGADRSGRLLARTTFVTWRIGVLD